MCHVDSAGRHPSVATSKCSGPLLDDPGSGRLLDDPSSGRLLDDPSSGRLLDDPSSGRLLDDPSSGRLLDDPSSGRLLDDPSSGRLLDDPSNPSCPVLQILSPLSVSSFFLLCVCHTWSISVSMELSQCMSLPLPLPVSLSLCLSTSTVTVCAGCAEADPHGGLHAELAVAHQGGSEGAQLQPHIGQDCVHAGHLQVPHADPGGRRQRGRQGQELHVQQPVGGRGAADGGKHHGGPGEGAAHPADPPLHPHARDGAHGRCTAGTASRVSRGCLRQTD